MQLALDRQSVAHVALFTLETAIHMAELFTPRKEVTAPEKARAIKVHFPLSVCTFSSSYNILLVYFISVHHTYNLRYDRTRFSHKNHIYREEFAEKFENSREVRARGSCCYL